MILKEGSSAPEFKLTDRTGKVYSLSSFAGKTTVLYFYPKDDTPGCTIEAKEFSAMLGKFEKLGVVVIGISGGDDGAKEKFCEKHDLKVLLLSDTSFVVSKKYGAFGEKKFMGKTYNGILRKTFIIDSVSKIVKIYDDVKAEGHASEVYDFCNNFLK
ncbi:MAG TPA: thioredoxin-dependent thiol peroxidase [Oligoflexia bacterium]|nr:thioredoxin-dependent thiol peroxidase [Oligoflexia bacterium]HMP26892.1 thioredoxin-dependent thiol peroxidase [Oligoflexia bacterium]